MYVALTAALLCVPVSNELVRRVGAHFLGASIEGNASISKVRLGIREIRIEQIAAWSRQCDQPTLSVESVTAKPSILTGLRSGVWFRSIIVDQPKLQLHFDKEGDLLTCLPSSQQPNEQPKPVQQLPFANLEINDAQLVVHQLGRDSLDVAGISLDAKSVKQYVAVKAYIPKLFAGRLSLHSDIDMLGQTAESELHVDGLNVTSEELVKLPLIPKEVDTKNWAARSSMSVHQSGSLVDMNAINVDLKIHDTYAAVADHELFELDLTATLSDAELATRVTGRLLGGTFESKYHGTLLGDIMGTLALQFQGITTDALPPDLLTEEVSGTVNGQANLEGTFANGQLQLNGRANSKTVSVSAYGVSVAPTTVEINVDGSLDFADRSQSKGMLVATILSEGVSLEQLAADPTAAIKSSPLKLPSYIEPSGSVRGAAQIRIPFASLDAPQSYRANGHIDATGVVANDILVKQGRGTFTLDGTHVFCDFRDIALVDQINGEPSSLSFVARGDLKPTSRLETQFRLNRLSAETLARLGNVDGKQVRGAFRAHVKAGARLDRIASPEAWSGIASLQASSITIDGNSVANCQAKCDVRDGQVLLSELNGLLVGGKLSGSGSCQLTPPFAFHGQGAIAGTDIQSLARLANQPKALAQGNLSVSMNAEGVLTNQQWRASGYVDGTKLRYEHRAIDDTRINFDAHPDEISAKAPPSGFLGGDLEFRVTGLSSHDLQHETGNHNGPAISGHIRNLPVSEVAKLAGVQERVEGHVSCSFAANSFHDLQSLDAVAVVESAGIAIRDAKLTQIRADLISCGGQAETQLSATGFGGRVELKANADIVRLSKLTAEQRSDFTQLPIDAAGTVTDISFQEIWPIIGQQRQLRALRGNVSASFERGDAQRQQNTVAAGNLKLRDLRWDNQLWSSQLQANVVLGKDLIELREFAGPFAAGRVTARGKVSLNPGHNGSFELSASRVSLSKALVPIDRRGELVTGQLSMRAQGRLGPRPSGRILLSMDRGTAGPIALSRLRVPVDWSLEPAAKSIQWRTSNAGLELGGGRVVTNASGRWNGKLDMSLTSTARRVDTGRIMKGNAATGGGFLDGTFRLSAKRATDANDFTGKFNATLSDASSLQLPVVSDLTKFLTALPTSTSFDESRIQGRLGNGMVHLDRVTLAAANAQVLAEGTATLQGRLDLQVMAQTNETGPADKLLELADSPLLMAAPTPLALVAKANNALKDRVVHLRIGGTAARPIIRLEPGRQLGQEAIKFFMNQAIAFRKNSNELSF